METIKIGRLCYRGLAGAVRTGNDRQKGHAVSGSSFLHFAEDLVILSGRGSRNPADLESAPIRLLHQVETFVVEIEDRKPGGKRLLEGSASRGTHRVVKFLAGEFVSGHTQIVQSPGSRAGNAGSV